MKKYLFLYYNKNSDMGGSMEDWENWAKELGDKLIDFGNPLAEGGQAVNSEGVMDVKDMPATGYSLIKAGSMDEAVKYAKSNPLLKSSTGAVCVYETLPM